MNNTSYRVICHFKHEQPSGNAQRFATREEAEAAGSDLLSRWLYPSWFAVEESTDPVNYRWSEGRAVRLEEVSS